MEGRGRKREYKSGEEKADREGRGAEGESEERKKQISDTRAHRGVKWI